MKAVISCGKQQTFQTHQTQRKTDASDRPCTSKDRQTYEQTHSDRPDTENDSDRLTRDRNTDRNTQTQRKTDTLKQARHSVTDRHIQTDHALQKAAKQTHSDRTAIEKDKDRRT